MKLIREYIIRTNITPKCMSAGVIGRRMKMEAYIKAIPELPNSILHIPS
jgi:N-acetylglutamate synthase/N-acetylornithine aminotransferase